MDTDSHNVYLTLEELLIEVARIGRLHRVIKKGEKISGRTVRYYIEKGLLPSVRSGPGKKYPYENVWQILFVRRLSTELGPRFDYLREAVHSVDVNAMERVVTGEEPLEILSHPDAEAVNRHAGRGYQVLALEGSAQSDETTGSWKSLHASTDIVLKVRRGLTTRKFKQLQYIAALIKTLEEDQ